MTIGFREALFEGETDIDMCNQDQLCVETDDMYGATPTLLTH